MCTECSFVTSRAKLLEEHFQRQTKEWHSCDICRLMLRNSCAFSAHMRAAHKHTQPNTCPECGLIFDGWVNAQTKDTGFGVHLYHHPSCYWASLFFIHDLCVDVVFCYSGLKTVAQLFFVKRCRLMYCELSKTNTRSLIKIYWNNYYFMLFSDIPFLNA